MAIPYLTYQQRKAECKNCKYSIGYRHQSWKKKVDWMCTFTPDVCDGKCKNRGIDDEVVKTDFL